MAKIVYVSPGPHAAYEYAEVQGGGSMTDADRAAFLDEHVTSNNLVPVETTFMGEVPTHKWGRYKADGAPVSALPVALPTPESDTRKLQSKVSSLEAQLAQALDQLGKKRKPNLADDDASHDGFIPASGGPSGTDEMRANMNTQDGVNLVGSGEEVREDMSTADRSDSNPVKRGPGRPPKA